MPYCPYCGTPLKETTFNRYWCPNCGSVEKDNNFINKEDGDSNKNYIG